MRITAQTRMMFSHLQPILAGLFAFSLTNPSSPRDTAIFVMEDLSLFLSAFFRGKNYFVLSCKLFAGLHQWLNRIAAEERPMQAKGSSSQVLNPNQ